MKYFIDSNIWVAAFNRKDTNHIISKDIVNNIVDGNMGIVCINNHVFDEVVTCYYPSIIPLFAESFGNSLSFTRLY